MASSKMADNPNLKPELPAPHMFPQPIIIQPTLDHRQSIIILHGRGSTASKFAPPLLVTQVTGTNETIQAAFPSAKLIFPTASRNRATIYKRSLTHQWFDNWHLDQHTERQDLMATELGKSVGYIHSLMRAEIQVVGPRNVVLWGLSQGCATVLACLLTWEGEPIAAAVGMSGWLPFANVMIDILEGSQAFHGLPEGAGIDDPFACSGDEDDDPFAPETPPGQANSEITSGLSAVSFLREELEMDNFEIPKFQNVPIFLGHGTGDDKVSIELGRKAWKCLQLLGADVQLVEYEGLGHWYSGDMLRDIFQFLKDALRDDKLVQRQRSHK